MILRLLCIWLDFYSLLSSLMHGTMNLKMYQTIRLQPKEEIALCFIRLLLNIAHSFIHNLNQSNDLEKSFCLYVYFACGFVWV
jgi:hypothetical protein